MTAEVEVIMVTSPASSFLSNLFDPSLVDPSFTEGGVAKPPLVTSGHTSSNSNSSIVRSNNSCHNCTGVDDVSYDNHAQYQQDVYFVLVIATCSVTVLIALTFALYRFIDFMLRDQAGNNSGGLGHSRQRRRQQRPVTSSVTSIPATTSPTGGLVLVASSLEDQQAQQQPPGRVNSIEFLAGFFSGSLPRPFASSSTSVDRLPPSEPGGSSGHHRRPRNSSSNGRSKRGDAPPPYDDPPPYHVAISMESMPDEDEEDGRRRIGQKAAAAVISRL